MQRIDSLLTQGALQKTWLDDLSISYGQYVETISVVSSLAAVDAFYNALGITRRALPAPAAGEPSKCEPQGVSISIAWVSKIDLNHIGDAEKDLYRDGRLPSNVGLALTLVPDALRLWRV